MGYSNGIITAPINTDDVCAALVESTHNIIALCASLRINMWAKYKPEAIGTYETLTLEQRKSNNFGLSPIAVYSGKSTFITAVNQGTFTGGWTYKRVSSYIYNSAGIVIGGAGDWSRLDDFVGYNHNAKSPFGVLQPFKTALSSDSNNKVIIPLDAPDVGDGITDNGCINIKDFQKSGAAYKDWYVGVLLYHSSRQFIATTQTPIGTLSDWQVDFGHLDPTYAATYKGVPFLSSKPYSVNGSEQAGVQIIGIGSAGVNIELVNITAVYALVLACVFPGDTNTIEYSLEITNNSDASRTFNNIVLYAGTSSSGANSVTIKSIGAVTVAARSRVTKTGTATLGAPAGYGYASNYYTWCRVSFTGAGSSDQTWIPIDQFDPGDYNPAG